MDENGDIYVAVANPGVFPGTPDFPNGASRPGPNLYTNSLVVLDGKTGKLKWHYQAIRHDIRDWDLHLGPILTTFTINGTPTDVVVLSGKMGTVYVVNRTTHKLIWKRDVGKHPTRTARTATPRSRRVARPSSTRATWEGSRPRWPSRTA